MNIELVLKHKMYERGRIQEIKNKRFVNFIPFVALIASIARCELNNNMCVRRESIYDQYQPEMDSKFRHRMDNRSEVQEIAFKFE